MSVHVCSFSSAERDVLPRQICGLALPFGPFELVASYYLYLHLNIRRHENDEIIILSRQLTKKLGPGYRELHVVARLQARIRRNSCPETLESFVQEAA